MLHDSYFMPVSFEKYIYFLLVYSFVLLFGTAATPLVNTWFLFGKIQDYILADISSLNPRPTALVAHRTHLSTSLAQTLFSEGNWIQVAEF